MKPHEKCHSIKNEETIRPEIQGSPHRYFGFSYSKWYEFSICVFRFKIFREFSHCVIHCKAEQFKNYGEKFTIKHSQLSCQTVTLISRENKIRNKLERFNKIRNKVERFKLSFTADNKFRSLVSKHRSTRS